MLSVNNHTVSKPRLLPRVLVVDDEPGMLELIRDVVGRAGNCRLVTASTLAQAEKILANEQVDLLLTDLNLPDGDGMSLLPRSQEKQPHAAAVVITGQPSVNGAVNAMRSGVVDFLPKPFTADLLLDRVNNALRQQAGAARREIRMTRLKGAVKKLNVTRHTISKKVDLLCNDLVAAYGELSRQLEAVRMQEAFRKLLESADDLEQMLCHAMDWILKNCGFCNVAVWLASDDREFELGAYMKYTIPGEPDLTNAIQKGLLPMVQREGTVHIFAPESRDQLTPAELKHLTGQEILGSNCTYLGESLAAVIMFRDEKTPFTEEDVAMLRAISPIFAVALANIVRDSQQEEEEDSDAGEGGALMDEDPENRKSQPKSDSDWWKRGEPPPF